MGTIKTDDYLVINRDNIDYKITAGDFKTYLEQFLPPDAVPPDTGINVSDWQFTFATTKPISMSSNVCVAKELNPFKNWATYAVTFDPNTNQMSFYHNGNLAGQEIMPQTPNNNIGNDLTIFALDPNNGSWRSSYYGWFRSFRLYNKVLTQSELMSNYKQDMDFKADYQQPTTPGALVVLDARKSLMLTDSSKKHSYVENLIDGSMDQFWWTDGGTGGRDGVTHPDEYLEHNREHGIWKANEGRSTGSGGYISSKYKPNLNTRWTMEFAFVPLSMGNASSVFMASCPLSSSSTLKINFSFSGTCSPVQYP